jgi:hypothetical protein
MEKAQARHCCKVAVLLAMAAGPSRAAASDPDLWQFAITPYLWFPNVSGALRFSGSSSTDGGILDVGTGPDSYLQNLQFLFMLKAEASKGNWTVFVDAIYLDFSQQQTNLKSVSSAVGSASVTVPRDLATDTSSGMSGALFQLAAGYKGVRAPWGAVEPFGGLRYLNLSAHANWTLSATFTNQGATLARQGNISQTTNNVDGIIGVRGRINLGGSRWYVPYYADIGAGTSEYTMQASAGVAYAARWGDIQLSYRYLTYELGGNELVQRLTLKGPVLSAVFRF